MGQFANFTQFLAAQAAQQNQRPRSGPTRRDLAPIFSSLPNALSNPVMGEEDRDRLLASLRGGLPQGPGQATSKGFANSLVLFHRAGINIPYGAGPYLPGNAAGNPLANFGNVVPIIQQRSSQQNASIGGPATTASLARLGAPQQGPGIRRGP